MIFNGKFRVTSTYGVRDLNGQKNLHSGIDVVGITSNVVKCVAGGVVLASQIITDHNNLTWQWGNYICIGADNGEQHYYCHLDKRLVKFGQRVNAGDTIGIMGNTGYSFGAHTHFESRLNGISFNPANLLHVDNAVGVYGYDDREIVRTHFGLSAGTMAYLDSYNYASDLYAKLRRAMVGDD